MQTALRAAGAVANSTSGTLAAATAAISTAAFTINTANASVTLATTSSSNTDALKTILNGGGTNLNSIAANTAVSGGNMAETKFTLYSKTVTGVTSIVSGTGSTLLISTQTDASAAISTVDSAINQVSSARAGLGAMQSRLESTSRSIAIASENAAAANSRIADADIAESMSALVRAQILQQAGISVLAQANQAPSLVLQLLR